MKLFLSYAAATVMVVAAIAAFIFLLVACSMWPGVVIGFFVSILLIVVIGVFGSALYDKWFGYDKD